MIVPSYTHNQIYDFELTLQKLFKRSDIRNKLQ